MKLSLEVYNMAKDQVLVLKRDLGQERDEIDWVEYKDRTDAILNIVALHRRIWDYEQFAAAQDQFEAQKQVNKDFQGATPGPIITGSGGN